MPRPNRSPSAENAAWVARRSSRWPARSPSFSARTARVCNASARVHGSSAVSASLRSGPSSCSANATVIGSTSSSTGCHGRGSVASAAMVASARTRPAAISPLPMAAIAW